VKPVKHLIASVAGFKATTTSKNNVSMIQFVTFIFLVYIRAIYLFIDLFIFTYSRFRNGYMVCNLYSLIK
jgi:hypothetical protein